jgi:serpin B
LPKFRVEYSAVLNETLQALGIRRAFSASQADFSGIGPSSLAIDQVLQKTYFDVTETGAEAAAVTAVTMMRASLARPHDVRVMNVNRPFLFVLAEKSSGQVLFVGKVENPSAK